MTKKLRPLNGIIIFVISFALLLTAGSYMQYKLGITGLVLSEIMFALVALISAVVLKADFKEAFPMRLPPVKSFFGGIMMYAGIYLCMLPPVIIMQYFFPDGVGAVSDSLSSIMTMGSPAVSIITLALLPAICEELLMRGIILSSLKPLRSRALAVIIVGVMFGLMHGSLYRFIPTAMLGGVFSFIALETESLVLPMLFHFINNAISVVSVYRLSGTASAVSDSAATVAREVNFGFASVIGISLLYIAVSIPLLYFGYCLLKNRKPKVNAVAVVIVLTVAMLIGGVLTTAFSSVKLVYTESFSEELSDEYLKSYEIEIESDGQYVIGVSGACVGGEVSYKLKNTDGEILDKEPYGESISKNSNVYLEKGTYYVEIAASKDDSTDGATGGLVVSQVVVMKIGK